MPDIHVIAHLGLNFWRKLISESPGYCFESNNAFLLCLDDDGLLLIHFYLTNKVSHSSMRHAGLHQSSKSEMVPKRLTGEYSLNWKVVN